MIKFNVPGLGDYTLHHLVMDVNGTLAVDGLLLEGVVEKITLLRDHLTIHLLTGDVLAGLDPHRLHRLRHNRKRDAVGAG